MSLEGKPIILYVDDEPNNLTVFEAALPEDWIIRTFDNPAAALNKLDEIKPWVVVSDQRMPLMKGVDFLDLTRKLSPNSVRTIVTGFSEEDLIIESVRKAQVFDYIRKPWDVDDLQKSLERAIAYYRVVAERESLIGELQLKNVQMQNKTNELLKMTADLEIASRREKEMVTELECWVPPFVLWALKDTQFKFPMTKDLVGITFDIIGSSKIHGKMINGKPLRVRALELFSEAIIRNGGWRESHSGDSAYAHFGLVETNYDPSEAALAAAREFRVSLRSLAQASQCEIECGIALHVARQAIVDVHKVQLSTPRGVISQKSFDTASSEIDLLHRIEKLVHDLPGSNIVMSDEFLRSLKKSPERLVEWGTFSIRGQEKPSQLHILPSDFVNTAMLEEVRKKNQTADRSAA